MVRSRYILAVALVTVCTVESDAFSPSSHLSSTIVHRQISLNAISTDRRSFAATVSATLGGVITASSLQPPQSATATEKWAYDNAKEVVVTSKYQPSFDDVKQLYGLGRSLDKLNAKVLDEAQWDDALAGLRIFNRDGNFYNGYAKNYISKVVKRAADEDPRLEYIKEASTLISSCEGLLRGEEGLTGADAAKEASNRTKKAQSLIAKFLAESGVKDDRVTEFVAAH